jgi:ligand-binding sensor domain-containing protein
MKFLNVISVVCKYLLVLAMLGGLPVKAQQGVMTFSHISSEQGLSNSTIEAIAQDHRGFIWIGTRDGLNLYDGKQMTVFRHINGNNKSISDNFVKFIYEDKKQTLWIGTTNGLNRYDAASKTFTPFYAQAGHRGSLQGNTINCILEDLQNNLWIGTDAGLNLINRQTGTFETSPNVNSAVNYISQGKEGLLWIAHNAGVFSYNTANKKLISVNNIKTIIKLIQPDKQGNLWLATESNGLLYFNPALNTSKTYRHSDANLKSLGSDQILSLFTDKAGHLWVGTINGGLNIYDEKTGSFLKYTYRPDVSAGLSQRTISAIYEDRQGSFWIGTHRGGINLYTPNAKKFNLYRQQASGNSLSYNDVKCFEEDHNGQIWIGTDGGGLNLFNNASQTFKVYRNSVNNSNSLASDAVLDITEDKQHRLWVATWGGGLNLFNPTSGTFERYMHDAADSKSISSNFVQNIYQDRQNTLWAGTYFGGLNRFDPDTKTFKRVITDSAGKTRLQGNNIVALNEDAEGNLWIGTDDGGLNCYRADTKQFVHYFNTEAKKPDIRVIFTDSRKRLWIGQSGLYLFNKQKNSFRLFTNKAGLDHYFIKGITEDNEGNLWVSTSNGLVKLNPGNGSVNTYNTGDGLQAMEFEANAYMKTLSGEMFFGGINGFNKFKPGQIINNPYIPPVYITGFQIFDKEVLPGQPGSPLNKDISFTQHVKLNYTQSSISFSFAALNYLAPQNNRYAYKLTRINSGFVYTQRNTATYTNLDPGDYTFTVKAANNDGVWNTKGTSITITITPPWWLTWWFKLLVFILAAGSVYAFITYRQNQHLKKLEEAKKEELHQLQLQFFTNISHEFRTPLTLILGPVEKLLNNISRAENTHAYQIIYRNAKRLMHLINELMDFRKAESGALQLKVTQGNINVFLSEIAEEFGFWAQQKISVFLLKMKMQATILFSSTGRY